MRVNGSLVNQDDADGWSLSKTLGPIIDGIQTYAQYQITLNGDARLIGRAGGNAVTVEYDFSYAAPAVKEYSFMVGAAVEAMMLTRIPPVGIDELNLNDVFVLGAEQAKEAVLKADAALAEVMEIRAGIGVTINGLGHQLSNVMQMGVMNEQSRSRILDADMAQEVMAMTKAQVMAQSAMAMLQHGRVGAQRVQELLSGAR